MIVHVHVHVRIHVNHFLIVSCYHGGMYLTCYFHIFCNESSNMKITLSSLCNNDNRNMNRNNLSSTHPLPNPLLISTHPFLTPLLISTQTHPTSSLTLPSFLIPFPPHPYPHIYSLLLQRNLSNQNTLKYGYFHIQESQNVS